MIVGLMGMEVAVGMVVGVGEEVEVAVVVEVVMGEEVEAEGRVSCSKSRYLRAPYANDELKEAFKVRQAPCK